MRAVVVVRSEDNPVKYLRSEPVVVVIEHGYAEVLHGKPVYPDGRYNR